jgi:hypothetical protein
MGKGKSYLPAKFTGVVRKFLNEPASKVDAFNSLSQSMGFTYEPKIYEVFIAHLLFSALTRQDVSLLLNIIGRLDQDEQEKGIPIDEDRLRAMLARHVRPVSCQEAIDKKKDDPSGDDNGKAD